MAIKRNNVYDEIKKREQAKAAHVKDLREKLEKARADKANAEAEAEGALNGDTFSAFNAAKLAAAEADNAVEYYEHQTKTAEAEPLYDENMRKEKADEIRKSVAEVEADKGKEIAKLLQMLEKEVSEIKAEYNRADEALTAMGLCSDKFDRNLTINGLVHNITNAADHILVKPYMK